MHMDTRVVVVADFKYEVKFDFRGHCGHLEAVMVSEATKIAAIGNMQLCKWISG